LTNVILQNDFTT